MSSRPLLRRSLLRSVEVADPVQVNIDQGSDVIFVIAHVVLEILVLWVEHDGVRGDISLVKCSNQTKLLGRVHSICNSRSSLVQNLHLLNNRRDSRRQIRRFVRDCPFGVAESRCRVYSSRSSCRTGVVTAEAATATGAGALLVSAGFLLGSACGLLVAAATATGAGALLT